MKEYGIISNKLLALLRRAEAFLCTVLTLQPPMTTYEHYAVSGIRYERE
jgi:hypothetical protein